MNKFFLFILFSFYSITIISAQDKVLKPNLMVKEAKSSETPENFKVLKLADARNAEIIPAKISSYSILTIDRQSFRQLQSAQTKLINFSIPQDGRNDLALELVEVQPFAEGFSVKMAPSMQTVKYNTGKHYRGIVKGQEKSVAAISIFDDQIMGVVSYPSGTGNLVLGKLEGSENHILYQDDQIASEFRLGCEVEDNTFEYTNNQLRGIHEGSRALSDCVRLYLEVDYDIYLNKGSSTTATGNFVTGIFNQVSTLYANEQINTLISEIVIWSQPSPYNSTNASGMLDAFNAQRQGFNGNLAQLLSYKASGGVAWLDGICRNNPDYSMSYAGIQSSYQNVPTYSWSVEVCAHEFGHLFGSQHTHACVWNGNNTAIDGCYTPEGSCPNPGLPSGGGTIMSYCHLTSTGINFANGFGLQPGNVMRSEVTSAACLQACSGGGGGTGGGGGGTACTDNVLSLEIRTDSYPNETTWDIRNSAGSVVYAGGPYSTPNTLNTLALCLPSGCYTFNIKDAYGDGICCGYGNGYFNIKQGASTLTTGGQFGTSDVKSFCTSGTTTSSLTLSASTGSVGATAGTTSVSVSSNVSWTASSNATSWCNVSPSSGTNNGTLNISYIANSSSVARSATITATGGGISRTYVLTQSGTTTSSLTLSASTGSVGATAGSTSVSVSSNVSWAASSNATSWCSVSPSSGTNNGTLNISYIANTTTSARSATITVTGGGISRTYALTQGGNTPSLTLSANSGT
ncbi:MAG: M12 family metallo-peptidase, partial [Saprospiraceae bacterium]